MRYDTTETSAQRGEIAPIWTQLQRVAGRIDRGSRRLGGKAGAAAIDGAACGGCG